MRTCLLIFLSILLFCACQNSSTPSKISDLERFISANGKVKVLSTTAMIGDIVEKVGGDYIDHITLIIGEVDPHSYELVKGDDEKIDFAQVVFYNGIGLEHGASLQYRLQHHPNSVSLGDRLRKSYKDRFLYVDGQIDPHIWMDVSLWKETVPIIVEVLSQLDPEHRDDFEKRADELQRELIALDKQIYGQLQSIPAEHRYLVTSHDAFNYFAKRYLAISGEMDWQKRFAAPEGLAPDGQLSAVHIQEIINHLQHYEIMVVFPESNVSKDSLRKIQNASKEKNMRVCISSEPLFGDAMGDEKSGANTYMKMMQKNAEVIRKELTRDANGN